MNLLVLLLPGAGPHRGETTGPGHQLLPHRRVRKWHRKHRLRALSLFSSSHQVNGSQGFVLLKELGDSPNHSSQHLAASAWQGMPSQPGT